MGVSKSQEHLIWTQNNRIPNKDAEVWETPVLPRPQEIGRASLLKSYFYMYPMNWTVTATLLVGPPSLSIYTGYIIIAFSAIPNFGAVTYGAFFRAAPQRAGALAGLRGGRKLRAAPTLLEASIKSSASIMEKPVTDRNSYSQAVQSQLLLESADNLAILYGAWLELLLSTSAPFQIAPVKAGKHCRICTASLLAVCRFACTAEETEVRKRLASPL